MYIEKINNLLDALYTTAKTANEKERTLRKKRYALDSKELKDVIVSGLKAIEDIESLTINLKELFYAENKIRETTIDLLVNTNKIRGTLLKTREEESEVLYAAEAAVSEPVSISNNSVSYYEESMKTAIKNINQIYKHYLSSDKNSWFADPEEHLEVAKTLGDEYADVQNKMFKANAEQHGDIDGKKTCEIKWITEVEISTNKTQKCLVDFYQEVADLYHKFGENSLEPADEETLYKSLNEDKKIFKWEGEDVLHVVRNMSSIPGLFAEGSGIFSVITYDTHELKQVEVPVRYYGKYKKFFADTRAIDQLKEAGILRFDILPVIYEDQALYEDDRFRTDDHKKMEDTVKWSVLRSEYGYAPSKSPKERRSALENAVEDGYRTSQIKDSLQKLNRMHTSTEF